MSELSKHQLGPLVFIVPIVDGAMLPICYWTSLSEKSLCSPFRKK